MKPFNFRLERILDYRKYIEKKAQGDLFNAKNECMKKEEEIQRLSMKRTEIANECSDEGFRGMVVPMYQIYQVFRQKLDHDLERIHISLKEGEEKVMEQEAVLKREVIKKKTLEVLKDLQHKTYRETLDREEQKILDEIVIIRRERSA